MHRHGHGSAAHADLGTQGGVFLLASLPGEKRSKALKLLQLARCLELRAQLFKGLLHYRQGPPLFVKMLGRRFVPRLPGVALFCLQLFPGYKHLIAAAFGGPFLVPFGGQEIL